MWAVIHFFKEKGIQEEKFQAEYVLFSPPTTSSLQPAAAMGDESPRSSKRQRDGDNTDAGTLKAGSTPEAGSW